MRIEPGTQLMHYRIVEKLGEGGMGVVWKAVDESLGREIAIKVLPETFAGSADRLARFEQEARLLASLNHPNIAAVYSVHAHEGLRFLAMELVDGEDLATRLARGPLALDETLDIAIQIARALEAAHDHGVIHRDLKPANVRLTSAGRVKVLDFGLAKGVGPETTSGNPALSPTITSAGTVAGVILGTAGYMSPEQARGRAVDRRADVWAFGCVLYEMLSGRRAFDGETVSDTLASILKVDPDWDRLPADTPPSIRRLIRRCLTRDPDRRLAHLAGALLPMSETRDGVDPERAGEAAPRPARRATWARVLPWTLVVLLGVAAVGSWRGSRVPPAPAPLLSLVAPFPDALSIDDQQMGVIALSPDGRKLALSLNDGAVPRLLLRDLREGGEPVVVGGTESAVTPFFSPDGQWVGFFANNKVWKVPVDGGNPIAICEASGNNRGASWGADDRIVFSAHYTMPLSVVGAGGGRPEPLTEIRADRGERTHRWPQYLPELDLVLFTVGTLDSPENYDGARIEALRPSTGERRTVLEGASIARWIPGGYLLFSRDGFLFATRFDVERLATRGTPVPVVHDVMGMRSSGIVHFDFAADGLLAYVAGESVSRESRMVWLEPDGRIEPIDAPVAGYTDPRISPDGRSIAVAIEGGSTFDIWIYDIERETSTRLTFEGDNTFPTWSPDGTRILFASVRNNAAVGTYAKNADGSGTDELVYAPDVAAHQGKAVPTDWAPDGRTVLIDFTDERAGNLMAVDLVDGERRVLLATPAGEHTGRISPDGRFLAYTSDESGRAEVYVRPHPGPGGKWQVSTDGGLHPTWSRDGKRLYFRQADEILVADVEAGDGRLRAGRPRKIVGGFPSRLLNVDYDVAPDGRVLIIRSERDDDRPTGVTFLVNWRQELERRLSAE
ncbi:MAG TPA: protein kinase [Candidatus Polarisedimenticolaceae bacterium]|nr:protein kinase [Candidatus Polarisedimenticolaceae bacterium]